MKIIIIGLGTFGSTLAVKLTDLGHEVIGVDKAMNKVEGLKEKVTHTICLDSTDPQAANNLPLDDADIVIVAIGEDEGANIMSLALMKQLKVKRLVGRALSPLHEMVLQTMGVDEIIHPEEETADRFAKKLNIKGVLDSFELRDDYNIIEAEVPDRFHDMTLEESGIRNNYNVLVLTTIKVNAGKNILGLFRKSSEVQGVASPSTVLKKGDSMVLYGNIKDIRRLLKGD